MTIKELKDRYKDQRIIVGESYDNPIAPIECDNCGKKICYAKEFDLNESYFYCFECIKKEFNYEM